MGDDDFISAFNVVDPEKWADLKEKIGKTLNFDTHSYRDKFLMRRVECRLRRNSIYSYEEYSRFLDEHPEERKYLEIDLTIHVTRFFRDVSLFRELEELVFPQVIKEKLEEKDFYLDIWSAGCSTGEEAYSISMIINEILQNDSKGIKVRIMGSDISKRTVANAFLGVYNKESLLEIPEKYKKKYLTESNGVYSVVPEIKKNVLFEVESIIYPTNKRGFDFIFCRNTIIYMEKNTKAKLFQTLYDKLKKGGFLVLGKTEFLDGDARKKFHPYNSTERIYRKPK